MIAASSRDYARSSMILSLGIVAEYGFRFVQKIILARLLFPEAFGLMGAVIAAASAIEAIADIGLRQSVIQHHRGGDPGYLNTVWCFSALRGLLLVTVALAVAPWCARYFQAPADVNLFRAGFAGILISSLISPRVYLLEKQFKFGTWALVMQLAAFTGSLSSIGLAFVTRNVWALIAGHLIELTMRVMLSYILCPFRPRLKVDRQAARDILRFSRGMLGLSALTILCLQIDLIFLGRMASLPVLGCYVMAKAFAEVLSFLSLKVVNPVFLPGITRVKDEPQRVAEGLYRGNEATTLFILPVMSFMILCARPLLAVAYGESYQIAARAFAVLCVNTLIFSCSSLFMILFIALGAPGRQRNAALVRMICLLAGIFPLIHFGELTGAAVAMCGSGLVMLVTQFALAGKMVPLRAGAYISTFWPGLRLSMLLVWLPWVIIHAALPHDAMASLLVTGGGAACAVAHAAWSMWRRHDLPGLYGLLVCKTA